MNYEPICGLVLRRTTPSPPKLELEALNIINGRHGRHTKDIRCKDVDDKCLHPLKRTYPTPDERRADHYSGRWSVTSRLSDHAPTVASMFDHTGLTAVFKSICIITVNCLPIVARPQIVYPIPYDINPIRLRHDTIQLPPVLIHWMAAATSPWRGEV